MTLEAQKIKFSNMEIYNSGNDLIFDATGTVTLNSSGGGEVDMLDKVVNINDKTIIGCVGAKSTSGTDLTVKGLGTGDIIFKCPNTQVTPIMRVQDNGIVLLDKIPTCSSAATTVNQILRYNNFDSSTSYTPTISGNTAGTPTYSSQSGLFYRIGNLVWMRANIVVTATTGITGTDELRISLPVAIDYTSIAMPQAITIATFEGIEPTNTDLVFSIGGTGAFIPGVSINFAKVYYKPNNSTNMTPLLIDQLVLPATFRYTGVYYIF